MKYWNDFTELVFKKNSRNKYQIMKIRNHNLVWETLCFKFWSHYHQIRMAKYR